MTDGSAVGSDLDSWVEEEGLLEHAQTVAAKRALAFQISEAMREQGLTTAAMAREMNTSRSALDRLLDPTVFPVTLRTLERAARVLGSGYGSSCAEEGRPPRPWCCVPSTYEGTCRPLVSSRPRNPS